MTRGRKVDRKELQIEERTVRGIESGITRPSRSVGKRLSKDLQNVATFLKKISGKNSIFKGRMRERSSR